MTHQDEHFFASEKACDKCDKSDTMLYHDRLTGLKNRDAFERDLAEKFSTIWLIDVDNFQDYNELYGIEIGNQVLAGLAQFISHFGHAHGYDAYRIYGDGYILKMREELLSHEELFSDISTFLKELSTYEIFVKIGDEEIGMEVSVTIALSMERAYTLEKAHVALNKARHDKKDFLTYFQAMDTQQKLKETLYWRKEIKEALKEGRMVPFFQPIVNAKGEVLKYEVLVRLEQESEEGMKIISPALFLDIAIKTKQYKYITRALIKQSFEVMKDLETDFSINLLFADMQDRDTMQFLKEQILLHELGDRLVLEIVESEDITDYELLKSMVERFRAMGVRIAIDDFGSGFSNYTYILEISPDYLKIDGSLIKEINEDEKMHKLVKSIQMLCSSLGIKTIAEYIHSQEVFDVCKKLDITEYQGFFFSAPINTEALLEREAKVLA